MNYTSFIVRILFTRSSYLSQIIGGLNQTRDENILSETQTCRLKCLISIKERLIVLIKQIWLYIFEIGSFETLSVCVCYY